MIDPEIQKAIDNAFDKRENFNQFNVSPIPFHVHNGTDSPKILYTDLDGAPSTTTKSIVRVYMSANTTLNGDQQIPFDTIDYDTNGEWDVTSKQFTAKTAGYYLCYFQAYYSGVNFAFQYAWRIYKNTSTVIQEINIIPANANMNPITGSVTALVQLAIGDKIDFHGYNQSGGGATVDKSSSLTYGSIIQVA